MINNDGHFSTVWASEEITPMAVKFSPESGGYTVTSGPDFIGRVRRLRSTYHHSNGRRYRGWSWAAFKQSGRATYHHRTRTKAVEWLLLLSSDGQ